MNDTPASNRASDDMHDADVANGENTEESTAAAPDPAEGEHLTGERQAKENRENDPPA